MIIVTDACAGKMAKTNIVWKCLYIDNTTGTASKQPYATVVMAVKKQRQEKFLMLRTVSIYVNISLTHSVF